MPDDRDRLTRALADRYRIERELGAGGMATVYLAEDLKHKRKVAVKVLRPELAAVLGAERFVQEIQTTAALQHPHILPLFDSGQAIVPPLHDVERGTGGEVGGATFLFYVMPYIDGETLREKLDRETQLGIEDAVRITTEVADALDYAHRNNVIHRDIKPENILLHDGRPMVADFGIALAVSAAAGGRMTETGLSLGTPHYMSPEQATAEKDITNRSDVYSLGSVLYEMLTGNPPHTGASAQQIIMRIVTEQARPVTEARRSVPPHVTAAVGKAIEKLPADRFESAVAFAQALGNPAFAVTSSSGVTPTTQPPLRAAVTYALGAIALLASAVAVWGWLRPQPVAERLPVRFTVPVPGGHELYTGETPSLAISPDGHTLVYASDGRLYRRWLGGEEAEPIEGSELGEHPFFSPDGQWIGFTSDAGLSRVPLAGGPVTRIGPPSLLGAAWGDDNRIVYTTRGGLWRIDAAGGEPHRLTTLAPGESEHLWPDFADGHRVLIYTVLGSTALAADARVVARDLESGRQVVIREGATYGRFVPPDHMVYSDGNGTLYAVEFELERLETVGEAFAVESGVRVGWWGGGVSFAISRSGTLAFTRGSEHRAQRIWWLDRAGRRQPLGEPVTVTTLALSPDGRQILTDVTTPTVLDLWVLDARTGTPDRLTFAEPGTVTYEAGAWSPDGDRIAFTSQFLDSMRVHVITRGAGAAGVLATLPRHHHVHDWSPDGEWLLLNEEHPERQSDLYALRIDSTADRLPVAQTPAHESGGQFSPDGRWVAYESGESGRSEIYVVSFPEPTVRRQLSANGGRLPRWSRAGGELFFWQDSVLIATRVSTAGTFRRDPPLPVLTMADADIEYARWDVSADGQRFLVAGRNPDAPAREIYVVVNWSETLNAARR